jgi:nucleoside-diphosphate-sugar epimerase
MGVQIEVETEAQRVRPLKSEVGRLLAGTKLAQELFGWKSAYTLDQGLEATIEYVKKYLSDYRVGQYTT